MGLNQHRFALSQQLQECYNSAILFNHYKKAIYSVALKKLS